MEEMVTHSTFLAGRFHGQRNLAGYRLYVTMESQDLETKQHWSVGVPPV